MVNDDGERGREVTIGRHPEQQDMKEESRTRGDRERRRRRKRRRRGEGLEERRRGVQRRPRSGFDPVASRGN